MEQWTFDPLIRRRAFLLSMAGAVPLLGCGKSKETVPSPAEPFLSTQACIPGEAPRSHFAAVTTHHLPGPYAWTNLVPVSMYERTPLPLMDGSGLLSFQGKLWLIGGWWPYAYQVQREIVNGVERIKRNPDGSIQYFWSDFHTQGFIKRTTNAVWCSSDGITWDNVKPDTYNTDAFNPTTDWAGRHAFGCVVFQNRMWIIGGDTQHIGLDLPSPLASENYSESSPVIQDAPGQNDIWSSEDGITWSKEGNLPFVHKDMSKSTRHIHSVLAFNNAMWLLGGLSDNGTTFLNDVWKSTNGKTWTRVLANMPNPPGVQEGSMGRWSPRVTNGHTVVHNNRMWILGGGYNDVWSSADGVNWRLELANDSSHENVTRWMARGYPQTASFEGKLWIFTGSNINYPTTFRYPHTWDCRQGATPPPGCIDTPDLNGNLKDVWHSTDGKQWMRYNHELMDPRHATASAVHGNTLVVQGGGWNDCWMLSPYVWERVEQNPVVHFGAIQGGQTAVSNLSGTAPRAWLLGAGNCIYSNAVWTTSDGSNWTLVKDNSYLKDVFDDKSDWAGRHMQSAVYFDNALWVVGGANKHTNYLDDVWRSADGSSWTRVAKGVSCLKRFFQSVLVFQNKIWVLGGQSTFTGANILTTQGSVTHFNDVWCSADGLVWSKVNGNAPWPARGQMGGALVFQDRIWVIGGGRHAAQNDPATAYNDVWSSLDGIEWMLHTADAPWSARRSHRLCVFDDRMWVIGGWNDQLEGGSGGHTRDIWYSGDGANWTQLPTPGNDVPGTDCALATLAGVPHIIGGPDATDVWRLRRRDGKV